MGAAIAALSWTLLQYLGTWLVGHELRHASQLYGYFGSILGLVSFLFIAAQVTLIAAEINVVKARHSIREVSRRRSPRPTRPSSRPWRVRASASWRSRCTSASKTKRTT